jgi:hypothetical protein
MWCGVHCAQLFHIVKIGMEKAEAGSEKEYLWGVIKLLI